MKLKLKKDPAILSERIHKRFAWLPVIVNHEFRWLEMVTTRQMWLFKSWTDIEFL